ncbi:MAG: hypothetical protein RL335_738 [Bacteroidota bacterium]|jgi:hypothetical protein
MLMKRQIWTLLSIMFIISCGKDTFQSKPQLTLKSVSSTTIPVGKDLQIRMRLTDKEGDFVDTIWVSKVTTRCALSNFKDSLLYRIPNDAPKTKNFDGEVYISFSYPVELQPRCIRPDTAVFSFWMKDAAGNRSDTVKTQPIIILRQ